MCMCACVCVFSHQEVRTESHSLTGQHSEFLFTDTLAGWMSAKGLNQWPTFKSLSQYIRFQEKLVCRQEKNRK